MNLCKHSLPEVTCRECSKPIDTRIEIPGSTLKMRPPKQKPRKEMKRGQQLKKGQRKRPMSPTAMNELVADVMLRDGRCLAIDHSDVSCMGQTDAAHVIAQRILREHYPIGDPIFSDKRNVMALCRRHHNQFDAGSLDLPREIFPDGFEDFCREHGFESNERYWYAA